MNSIMTPPERYSSNGVQLRELDEGKPCHKCKKCLNGFEPHSWRKNCKNCMCNRDSHDVSTDHGARSRLGFSAPEGGIDTLSSLSLIYSFVPTGLTSARQVEQYYASLPTQEVPKLGTKGELNRVKKLIRQLPRQDLAIDFCKYIEDSNRNTYYDFVGGRNQISLDIGNCKPAPPNSTCAGCSQAIPNQQISVWASRMGKMIWHPSCFRCTTCDDLLVDLAYCVHDDKIYCERHYAENYRPRCEGCDEVSSLNLHWF